MILGGKLASSNLEESRVMSYLLFPLVVHVADLLVSFVGVMAVRKEGPAEAPGEEDPMSVLKRGYVVAVALAAVAFTAASWLLLSTEAAPAAWWCFGLCGGIGMLTGFLVVLLTQYYTDSSFAPVRGIARASESGHGTNIIAGLAVGLESTMLSVLLVVAAILSSYALGRASGLEAPGEEDPRSSAGLFGTAVATMGMLSNLTYVLAMDVFGPIADNAAGIVEMSDAPGSARDTMDRLDAAGNTTKAFTKGFAVSSAGLACFLLFRAFLDLAEDYSGNTVALHIDIVQPESFCAGLVGSATVFLFASSAMQAVGDTAQQVVLEVRRQFAEIPGIGDGAQRPEYGACVEIVSRAAISKMVQPGLLVVVMPVLVGGAFRLAASDPLLGARSMTAYLVCSSMTAMLLALFLNNGGGAWDNAKKFIEFGNHGGKGSDAHKAAVTGDTVGDPCKDTAGPSLHVLMKLTATVTMVVGPLVAIPKAP